jgi:aquaporin Z
MMQKLGAEFIGTFVLVLCACGAGVLGHIGLLGGAIATGLGVMAMIYAVGPVSGGYFNPALTIAAGINCRISCREVLPYIIAQTLGALAAAFVLATIASGKATYDVAKDMLGATGFGEHSPEGYAQNMVLLSEIVVTAIFSIVMLGATHGKIPAGFAPIAISVALVALLIIEGNVSGGSLNPARSTGPAVLAGGWAMKQLWMFWVAPIAGAIIGGYLYKWSMCCSSCGGETCCSKK